MDCLCCRNKKDDKTETPRSCASGLNVRKPEAESKLKPEGASQLSAPTLFYPSRQNVKTSDYVRRLECEYACMQKSILTLTTHFARMQFRLRQILQAQPSERLKLLKELEKLAFEGLQDSDYSNEMPHMKRDLHAMGAVKLKQNYVITKLRGQLATLQQVSAADGLAFVDGSSSQRKANGNSGGNSSGGSSKTSSKASSKASSKSSSKNNSTASSNSSVYANNYCGRSSARNSARSPGKAGGKGFPMTNIYCVQKTNSSDRSARKSNCNMFACMCRNNNNNDNDEDACKRSARFSDSRSTSRCCSVTSQPSKSKHSLKH